MNDFDKKLRQEIDLNYEAFQELSFDVSDVGKFALMKDGKLREVMDTKLDAHKLARVLYEDEVYSIQEIAPRKHDLGFMNYALRAS